MVTVVAGEECQGDEQEQGLGEFGAISDHMVQVITNAFEHQIADPASCAALLQKQKNGELTVDAGEKIV